MDGDIESMVLGFHSVAVTSTRTKSTLGKAKVSCRLQVITGESQDKDSSRNLKQKQWRTNQMLNSVGGYLPSCKLGDVDEPAVYRELHLWS